MSDAFYITSLIAAIIVAAVIGSWLITKHWDEIDHE